METSTANTNKAHSARRTLNRYIMIAHILAFLMSVVMTVVGTGISLYIIITNYESGEMSLYSSWAQANIAFLMGMWISDRPRLTSGSKDFIRQKKRPSTTTVYNTSDEASSRGSSPQHMGEYYP